jgi:cytochrome c-type protein NapB
MRRILWAVLLVSVVGCGRTTDIDSASTVAIPDTGIGLSASALTDVPDPLLFERVSSDPGDVPLPLRAFEDAPPAIPHTLEDMLPITLTENLCVECHWLEEKAPGDPTPIPKSHFEDLRHAPGKQQDTVPGARYLCISCHTMQSDAKPLVRSSFQP